MSKPVKAMISKNLQEKYADVSSACVVELTGLNVKAQEKLRATLRGKSAQLHVVKNSLARVAFKDGPLGPLSQAMQGPCALITSTQSLIDVARALMEAAKEFKNLKLKKAVYEGDPTLLTIEELARMRGKREILGELAMLIASPGRAIAGCIQAPQSKIAGCLKAIADKGETEAA